jgi:hypothetical protein
MLRTARISSLIQYDDSIDPLQHLVLVDAFPVNGAMILVGSLTMTAHKVPRRTLEPSELRLAGQRMEQGAGSFMSCIGEALTRADSVNSGRIIDEFWNEIMTYLPEST